MIFTRKKLWWMQYNLRCNYCGENHFVSKWVLYLRLITRKCVRYQCKKCSRQSWYILESHVVHDSDKSEKIFNRDVEKAQTRVRSMRGLR